MKFAIKYRRITSENIEPAHTLAIDIEGRQIAEELVQNLAGSFENHGCDLPPLTHWFRSRSGMHLIWAQMQ